MTQDSHFPPDALDALRNALGNAAVVETPAHYLHEPRDLFTGNSAWLCKPSSTDDVVRAVQICNTYRVPIVPYGGGTGLVGGQTNTAAKPTLLLSTERLIDVRRVDPEDSVLVCGAGLRLHAAQELAARHDKLFPLSLASEGSCTVGGNLATNAGGINVLRYGNARALCLGVEAVLADGTVVSDLRGLRKDNTGYALSDLLVGSEGTLGIITAAALRLFPQPRDRVAAFIAVPDPNRALALLGRLQDRFGERVSAFELIARQGIDFLAETGIEHRLPIEHPGPWYVLTEVASGPDMTLRGAVEDVLSDAAGSGELEDAVLAANESQRTALWHVRESIPEANRLVGSVASFDIAVPISAVPAFIAAGSEAIQTLDPDLRINCFGHFGDGNLHFNTFPPRGVGKRDKIHLAEPIKSAIYALVDSHGGTFSAEHGVGRQKVGQLNHYGDEGKLHAMRSIKRALDPNNLLNPGAVIAE